MIKISELLINGIDYGDYASIPLQTQETLDESLDIAYIELKGLEIDSPFVPFSDVYLKIQDGEYEKEYYLLVESDNVTEIIANNKYDHNLLIIEETKWLERFFVEKAVTNPIVHDYVESSVPYKYENITIDKYGDGDKITTETILKTIRLDNFKSPLYLGTTVEMEKQPFNFPSSYGYDLGICTATMNRPDGTEETITFNDSDGVLTFNFDQIGLYTFDFHYGYTYINSSKFFDFHFEVSCIVETPKKEDYKISEVINNLLLTYETIRESQKNKVRFELADIEDYIEDDDYKEKVLKILNSKSPEFYFSKMSLFEALKMIGDYAHFIPRMKNRKIYLDLLGLDKYNKTLQDEEYFSNTLNQSTNDFCTKLDSQVDNFVNLDSDEQGSVVTPFNDGYRTLRTDFGQVRITEQNIIIPTESPIEKIIKLEIGYLEDGTYVGDITPYVYENAEYEALSSYSDDFPWAKMYALKYTAGSPNITGLSFKRENAVDPSLEGIAIKNIIKRKLNRSVSWWANLRDSTDTFLLQYRLTYIPSTSTRITQSKAYKDNITKTVSIAYNQSASKISSNAYGENLKGKVLKMGNVEKQRMFVLPGVELIPQCGQKYDDDYYISVVKCEYYPNLIKCEVGLSKDFNNKGQYVEIDSQLRFYEISEKMAYDIYKIYEDYCEIGFDNNTDNLSLITNDGLDKFSKCFNYGYKDTNLSVVKAKSIDHKNNEFANFALPITSLGVGNSMLFEFHYVDNYSAGNIADYDNLTRVQTMTSYVDNYGEVEKLGLQYGKNTTILEEPYYDNAIKMGDIVPYSTAITSMETYFDTEDNPIILKKDNREAIHFTYQIHFVANNNNLIIGSGLARYSPFVTNETLRYKLVLLKDKLSKFENEIDLTNSYQYDSIIMNEPDYENKKISLANVVAPKDNEEWKSWAIVQTMLDDKNEISKAILILGENKDIKSGDIIEMPNFVFKHKIVED